MKYAIIKVINGNFSIHGEYNENLEGAKINFHNLCASLWNAQDVLDAMVKIVDNNLNTVERYMEYIYHSTPSVSEEGAE